MRGRKSSLNYTKGRGYYTTVAKRKRYLGFDKAQAEIEFARLISQHLEGTLGHDPRIDAAVKLFLDHYRATKSSGTYDYYRYPLEHFIEFVGKSRRISTLRVGDVTQWVDKNWLTTRTGKASSANSQIQPRRAVKRCFKWLMEEQHISHNPFSGLKVGSYTPCQTEVSDEQFAAILNHWKRDRAFIDLLTFEALTGCRVQEVVAIRTAWVDRKQSVITFDAMTTKGHAKTKRRRVIVLSAETLAIVQRNMVKHPDGLLFQNPRARSESGAWDSDSIRSRFRRAEKKLGFRIQQKNLRHMWATKYLKKGGNAAAGAALMGHANARMILLNYSHVQQDLDYLKQEAQRVTNATA